MKTKSRYFLIITLLSLSLACGVATLPVSETVQAPQIETSKVNIEPGAVMVVTASDALNIRSGPGESYSVLSQLKPGQVVTCIEVKAVTESSLWCHHLRGWSNIKWMKGK